MTKSLKLRILGDEEIERIKLDENRERWEYLPHTKTTCEHKLIKAQARLTLKQIVEWIEEHSGTILMPNCRRFTISDDEWQSLKNLGDEQL